MKKLLLVIILILIIAAIPVTLWLLNQNQDTRSSADTGTKLRWAPPELSNPETIELGTGETEHNLSTSKDYIIKFPPTRKNGRTVLSGGRNIVIIGGHASTAKTLPDCNNPCQTVRNRVLQINNATGIVHIEGMLFDATGGYPESDAITIGAPDAIVQIQNVRMQGFHGTFDHWHADLIQPWGGVKELRIDHFTGDTNYQAFYYVYSNIQNVIMQNINVKHNGGEGKLMYMSSTSGCSSHPGSVSFSNVYFQPRPGSSLPNEVVPDSRSSCEPTFSNNLLSFPTAAWVTGSINQGPPPGGDFVPAGTVGVNYISPGYSGINDDPQDNDVPVDDNFEEDDNTGNEDDSDNGDIDEEIDDITDDFEEETIQDDGEAISLIIPPVRFVAGDVNNDNQISILDYNAMLSCYQGIFSQNTSGTCSDESKTGADLNDDGNVDIFDLNLFLRELSTHRGDE